MLTKPGGDKNGLFWINPDGNGDAFQVYCEQESAGGGWILLQHNHKVDSGTKYPCGLDPSKTWNQKWSDWLNKGILDVSKYAEYKSAQQGGIIENDNCYWMAFKHWERIVGNSADGGVIKDLMMVPQAGWGAKIGLFDFYVSKTFGLQMSNREEIKGMMCRGSNDCFVRDDIGFSTKDNDRDQSSTNHCAKQVSAGWWYNNCYYHHQTKPVSQTEYGGCQGGGHGNCGTQYWSWFVK